MINGLKIPNEWKTCLTMKMNFMSSKDFNENSLVCSNSDNK